MQVTPLEIAFVATFLGLQRLSMTVAAGTSFLFASDYGTMYMCHLTSSRRQGILGNGRLWRSLEFVTVDVLVLADIRKHHPLLHHPLSSQVGFMNLELSSNITAQRSLEPTSHGPGSDST